MKRPCSHQLFLWLCWPALTCCSCEPPRVDPSDPDSFEPDPLVFLWLCSPALACCSDEPPRVDPSDPDSFEPDPLVFLWLCSPALLCCSEEPPRSLFGILTLLLVGIGRQQCAASSSFKT